MWLVSHSTVIRWTQLWVPHLGQEEDGHHSCRPSRGDYFPFFAILAPAILKLVVANGPFVGNVHCVLINYCHISHIILKLPSPSPILKSRWWLHHFSFIKETEQNPWFPQCPTIWPNHQCLSFAKLPAVITDVSEIIDKNFNAGYEVSERSRQGYCRKLGSLSFSFMLWTP